MIFAKLMYHSTLSLIIYIMSRSNNKQLFLPGRENQFEIIKVQGPMSEKRIFFLKFFYEIKSHELTLHVCNRNQLIHILD